MDGTQNTNEFRFTHHEETEACATLLNVRTHFTSDAPQQVTEACIPNTGMQTQQPCEQEGQSHFKRRSPQSS